MIKIPQPSKLFASNAIFATLLLAIFLGFGITLSANDFLAQDTTTTETASLFDGVHGYTQLAAEGGGGGSRPSPSSSGATQSGQNAATHAAQSNGGRTTASPSGSSPQGQRGTGTNQQTQSQTQGRGGQPPSGRDPAMGGGGGNNHYPSENSGRNPNDSFNGSGGGRSGGAQSSNQTSRGGDRPGGSPEERAQANAESKQQYARDLANYGAYKNPSSRVDSITRTINNTTEALSNALGGLFGSSNPADKAYRGNTQTKPAPTNEGGYVSDVPTYKPSAPSADRQYNRDRQATAAEVSAALQNSLQTAPVTKTPEYSGFMSPANMQTLNELKRADNKLINDAQIFQDRYKGKVSIADSIVSVSEIRKSVAGECMAGCTNTDRIAIANAIMNRIDYAVTRKTTFDVHDALDAIDSNMQRPKTLNNKVYARADIGTPVYNAGAQAVNDVLVGKLPADMPPAVRTATHYYATATDKPWWANGPQTPFGPHIFSNDLTSGVTPAKVADAQQRVARGEIKAEISYYNGAFTTGSLQAKEVQKEVNRSLKVAGRDVHIVTLSTGVTNGPGVVATGLKNKDLIVKPDSNAPKPAGFGEVKSPSTPQNVAGQKTSLDDAKSSNIPSPADVRNFMTSRGWPLDKPIDSQYAYRLSNIVARAEIATGVTAPSNYFSSTYRSPEYQAQIKATFTGKNLVYNGKTYHPDKRDPGYGKNWKAALPGHSPHQYGQSVDTVSTVNIKDPKERAAAEAINNYIQSHTPMHNALQVAGIDPKTGLPPVSADPSQTGLERVTNDQNHVQIGGFKSSAPHSMNTLDSSIGAGGATAPTPHNTQQSGVTKTPNAATQPSSWMPSFSDLKKKAQDAVAAVAPSPEAQKNLEFVSKLPTWMQKIVFSVYTGKGEVGTPSDTLNTESHSGVPFFPEEKRATSTSSARPTQQTDVTQLPWWQQYQEKLNALKQNNQQHI